MPRKACLHTWRRLVGGEAHLRQAAAGSLTAAVAGRSRAAAKAGGAYRDRTDDLKLAKLALSQLS